MFLGGRQALRGFRPRSETNYLKAFAVVLGVATGIYVFDQPLQQAAVDIKQERAQQQQGAAASTTTTKPAQ